MVSQDDPFDRIQVSNKSCTLDNLNFTLRPAYEMLKQRIEGRSLILCFGLTGCGKSTLLNALLYGSESLQLTTHSEVMRLRNGETRTHNR